MARVFDAQEGTKRALDKMPFDKRFICLDGHEELCHATGEEVYLYGEWWNVYIDSDGYFHLGR